MGDDNAPMCSPSVVSGAPGAVPRVARLPAVAKGMAASMLNTVKLRHTGTGLFRLTLQADKSLPLQ